MSEIISPENTELLAHILGDLQQESYIEAALGLQNQLEKGIEAGDMQSAEINVVDYFAPGVYMRQMNAKAGTLVVGKMNRNEHINILLTGSLTVATEKGIKLLTAPVVLKSMPGTKRIGYFHEDSSWITVHPTNETDLELIEQQVIVPDHEIDQFLASLPSKCKEIK
ncbi:hypothetical protein E0H80_02205 [Acinetobacter sp. ANC 4779]|uniref:hypothetical protein n=1 Tax=Acinetobacter sp. ANC 4779 TaxID=2529848 RepID=UPI00103E8828|nr:hypothetical protein [Acinetobacter sp. ANC 4779]TCB52669.1 hypothetical protein E0H80_02205 [Acinetobacter sp. ANC 4779]